MNTETFVATIRSDLLAARKARDVLQTQALLSLLNAIDNASAVDVPVGTHATEVARRELSVEDVKEIISNEILEMQEALAMYKDAHPIRAEELEIKIAILQKYNQEDE